MTTSNYGYKKQNEAPNNWPLVCHGHKKHNSIQYSREDNVAISNLGTLRIFHFPDVGEVGYFNTTAYSAHPDQNVIFDWHYS